VAGSSRSDRPSDHIEGGAEDLSNPKLGPMGWVRFLWRQLTSMRTALFLLLLLAVAAIPGSLVPQRSSDPNGVVQFRDDNPALYPVLEWFKVFDTYSSPWFSAVYLLLFVSLIGCVIPRTKHHLTALRARPPKTPARLSRLAGFTTVETKADAETVLETGERLLKRQGYRVERYGDSLSAERGYLRETGNLVFHSALVGVLVTVGIGGGFGYSGQRVVVEGQKFVNVLGDYDSFNPGRFFMPESLVPFRLALDDFSVDYELENINALGAPYNYTATVTTTIPGSENGTAEIKVNEPLDIEGSQVYLLGNGYAPTLIVRDPEGTVVWTDSVPFLPSDANLTSVGVVKVPDGLDQQLGMAGFFYPTARELDTGALASSYPDLINPVLTLRVYQGDLGLDDGVPRSVYALETEGLEQIAGSDADVPALQLSPGDRVDLPNGLGSIEMTDVKRFVSLDIHRDPSQLWVLGFSILVIAGLLTSLFVPRRRVWIKAVPKAEGIVVEYAGLARGEDPTLDRAVTELAQRHAESIGLKVDK